MSAEQNKATVVRYFEETYNHRNLDIVDELCTPQHAASHKEWQRRELAALPDTHFKIEEVVAEGDWVALCWIIPETHRGGYAPCHDLLRPLLIPFDSFILCRLENGKIAREWHFRSQRGLFRQMEAEPAPADEDLRNAPTAET